MRTLQEGPPLSSFSASAQIPNRAAGPRKKVIFDKASSPELDEVFTEMLHKIILPAHLPRKQRQIISNAKNAQRIEVDPIVIEVEGYEHRFPILDYRLEQVPNSNQLFWKAVRLMKTRDDWANLTRLTSGYHRAHRQIDAGKMLGIVRWAGRTGNIYAVIDALRNSKVSHLYIRLLPVADNILHYLQTMALDADYAEKPTRDARTWAVMVHELAQDPVHAKQGRQGRARWALHREPQVVGQVLHLAAAHAALHRSGADEDGRVAKLAEMLAIVWPEGRRLKDLHAPYEIADKPARRIGFMMKADAHLALAVSRRISIASFIVHGIGLAKRVVEPELAARLEPIEKVLREELAELAAQREQIKADEGWSVYDKLMAKT